MRSLPIPALLSLSILGVACTSSTTNDVNESEVVAPDADEEASLPDECKSPEIVAMKRPRVNADPSKGSFTYRVRFRKPASPDQPTVVHLPGGPGMPSIGHEAAWLPPEMGLVQTDPRGVACNPTTVKDPASFYRSAELAEDVIAAIRHLELTNYVLHGHSYGTALATRVAHLLAERDLPKPKAVLLEGVLSRAFKPEWMGQTYVDEWDAHMKELPPEALAELAKDEPLGIDGKTWGNAFMALTSAFGKGPTHNILSQVGTPDAKTREDVIATVKQLGGISPLSEAGLTLQRFIACREISMDIPKDNVDVVVDHGKLVKSKEAGTLCTGLTMSDPFDAKEHAYPFRTFYFLGQNDPATPVWQGKGHFDGLKSAQRVELVVAGSGHMVLQTLGPCAPALVGAAARGAGFNDALSACGAPVEARFANAGE